LAAALPSNSVERFTCRQRTFAQVIAMATVHRGLRKTSAVKFLVQLTEGPAGLVSRETNQADIEFVEDSGVIGFVSYLPR